MPSRPVPRHKHSNFGSFEAKSRGWSSPLGAFPHRLDVIDVTDRRPREKNRPGRKARTEEDRSLKTPKSSDDDVTPATPEVYRRTQQYQERPTRQARSRTETCSYYNRSRSPVNNVTSTRDFHYLSLEDGYLDTNHVAGQDEPDASRTNILSFQSGTT